MKLESRSLLTICSADLKDRVYIGKKYFQRKVVKCSFALLLYVPVHSYGHGGMVNLSNHIYFPGQALSP